MEFAVLSALKKRNEFLECFWPNLREVLLCQQDINECVLSNIVVLREDNVVVFIQNLHVCLVYLLPLLETLHHLSIIVVEYVDYSLKDPKSCWLIRGLQEELEETDNVNSIALCELVAVELCLL